MPTAALKPREKAVATEDWSYPARAPSRSEGTNRQTIGWVQASLDYRQRLQQLFFPEGIADDGNRFNRNRRNGTTFQSLWRRLKVLMKRW